MYLNFEDADCIDYADNHHEEEDEDDDDGVEVIDDGVDRDGGSKLKAVAVDSTRRCLQNQFRLVLFTHSSPVFLYPWSVF